MATVPFEPRRFRTSAAHYVRGRHDYPPELIARVASAVGLGPGHRVLDLGCGPGFLAVGFAPCAGEVVGIDPEPAMLEAAADYARERSVQITLRQGSSYDLGPDLGLFRLAVMGRSFHWMDRAATLQALDRMIEAEGAVALFADSHLEVPENAWAQRFRELLKPYAERDPSGGPARRRDPSWLPHEAFLLRSAFCRLERFSVIWRTETPAERLVDRALSMSTTSPERLGAERDGVVARLRDLAREVAPDGTVTEVVESEALIGFRSLAP